MYAHEEFEGSVAKLHTPCRNPQETVSTTTPSFPHLEIETWRGLEVYGRLPIVRGKDTFQSQTEHLRGLVFHFWATLTLQS